MNRLISSTFLALALLAGTSAFAQEQGGSIGAAYLGDYQNQTWGLGLDLAYTGKMESADLPYRLSLGYLKFLADIDPDTKSRLADLQVAADVFLTKPNSKLGAFVGLSANNWTVSSDASNAGSKGVKLGFRAGVEYNFSSSAAVTAMYQLTELGTDGQFKNKEALTGSRGINPSWIQVGVRFHF